MLHSVPRALTSKRGAWLSLVIGVLTLVALMGVFGRAALGSSNAVAAPSSESARVSALAGEFPDGDAQTLILVATRADGGALEPAVLSGLVAAVGSEVPEAKVLGPFPSADGAAAVIQATVTGSADVEAERELVAHVRTVVGDNRVSGVDVQVTGGPAFGADVAGAFAGADFTLLLVTIGIVALLLILTYRSPVLWLIPLTVVGLADQVASKVTAAMGHALGLQFDTGIVSVLVFGAGTNYTLLLVSRYRERLHHEADHRVALAQAWRGTFPAIAASNLTVVVSLLTLVLAVIPGTRGLGIACAAGLLIALAAVLLVLPPALAVCGRGVFWPFVPKPGEQARQGRVWRSLATRVTARPWVPLVGGLALLGVMATGLLGASIGLNQVEKFRVPSESAVGLEVLGEHFPPGQAQPFVVIAAAAHAQAVADAAAAVDGVLRVSKPVTSDDGSLVRLTVTGEPAPGTPQSRAFAGDLRDAVHAVPTAGALVGGQGAVDVDARDGNLHDVALIAPLVLIVTLVVLIVLLRSIVAPVILLLVNTLSAVAAIGAGTWLSRVLFGWHALDLQVPLLTFLFLVALGVDYTIFLVHRARTEAAPAGTKAGMVNALAATGGVITSAGVVLAGVFAALGLLPLVTLGQIGLIVGVGVLVDTLVVRTLVVPALFAVLGDRMWWPGRIRATHPAATGTSGPRIAVAAPDAGESDHVADTADTAGARR